MGLHVTGLGGATHNLLLGTPSYRVVGLAGACQMDLVMCPFSLDLVCFHKEGWRRLCRRMSAHLHG